MKKAIAGPLAAILILTQTLAPTRAEAGWGVVATASGAPILGIPAIVAGGVVTGYGLKVFKDSCSNSSIFGAIVCMFMFMPAAMLTGVGIMMLDDGSGQSVAFGELSLEEGGKLGLTDAQIESYNWELEEIQAVSESIQSEVGERLERGEPLESIDVSALWGEYREAISPDAFSALEAVSVRIASLAVAQ